MFETQWTKSIATTAILCPIAILAVLLRFLARSRTRASYAADDWLAAVTLMSLLVWFALYVWCMEHAPEDIATLTQSKLTSYLKRVYALLVITPLPMFAAKLSILFLCRRLFYHDRQFRKANTVVGILCILWYIAATLGMTLKCLPIRKSWDLTIDGSCIKLQDLAVAIEVPNSIIDFVIVALSIRVVKAMQLSLSHKIALYSTFILGGSVGVFGLIRIGLMYGLDNSWMLLVFLVAIQQGIACICACIPTFRPLLPKENHLPRLLKNWRASVMSVLGSRSKSSALDTPLNGLAALDNRNRPRYNQYDYLDDTRNNVVTTHTAKGAFDKLAMDVAGKDYPMNAIKVKHEVQIT